MSISKVVTVSWPIHFLIFSHNVLSLWLLCFPCREAAMIHSCRPVPNTPLSTSCPRQPPSQERLIIATCTDQDGKDFLRSSVHLLPGLVGQDSFLSCFISFFPRSGENDNNLESVGDTRRDWQPLAVVKGKESDVCRQMPRRSHYRHRLTSSYWDERSFLALPTLEHWSINLGKHRPSNKEESTAIRSQCNNTSSQPSLTERFDLWRKEWT